MKISNHAVDRFCERVRPVSVERARDEMMHCLHAAQKKHLDGLARRKGKKTFIVPTGCCMFVFEQGVMVTVLPKRKMPRDNKRRGNMTEEKYELKAVGPTVVVLPTWENWPKSKTGEPMEIRVTNIGTGDLTVQQDPAQFIVAPAERKLFLRDE
jgi:hypothetical protein